MNTSGFKVMLAYMLSVLCIMHLLCMGCKRPSETKVMAAIMSDDQQSDTLPSWMLGPFIKVDSINSCLTPSPSQVFTCPVRNQPVRWEEKDVFNPAIIVRNGKLQMVYRAEDSVGRFAGTSRLGLAESMDGLHFKKHAEPVFFPDRDQMFQYEWEGGCEDPRIVRRPDGLYVMTYTAYDGSIARLCIASSRDLRTWTKHGLAFTAHHEGKYADLWSKSGSIISRYDTTGIITARMINNKYWMYWGDKDIHLATSPDLLAWTPLTDNNGELRSILLPRPFMFDSDLVEPGPPAVIREDGILLIYNSRNYGEERDTTIAEGTYSAGQVLFDMKDPTKVLQRSDKPFFTPDRPFEISGQVNRVVFIEGLVQWKNRWWMFYGTADSKIAVACAK